ncbi:nucleotide-binding domain-containing protein [Delitschia confertaspora ATCC 74209]|uniref:Nucleotide-binding domain-containing protein n=1 Tax=Delitschia confertaspora ATCC 74209 TaxID=1513339 RepID=A0A9P4JUD6_9PLEO|nr:nucleotide-binding domain-containing protein [Delitschia confertaspora ATCC 74209]
MAPTPQTPNFLVFGAGVIGLTTALTLRRTYPTSTITIVAKHFPGDRSIEYCSPWAGANWSSMAHDNGPLEHYDRITFQKFSELADHCPEAGIGRFPLRLIFEEKIEKADLLTEETGEIWYRELVGGIREVGEGDLRGAEFGFEHGTFRINTQVYLGWLQNKCLTSSITLSRRTYLSLSSLLSDFPSTTLLLNCTGLGSLHLTDVRDTSLYPTRGQTVLVQEPETPIPRMYIRSPKRVDPDCTYVFPRPLGGGVVLGGSRQEGDWDGEVDMKLAKSIMEKCCSVCPELGKVEDLKVLGHGVGLRTSRKGGVRVELEMWANGTPVVHNYGHSGAGYQSSWGTAERAMELVKKALDRKVKL